MTCSIFFLQKKSERITTCWENNKCMHKEIHALQYSWPAVMDFAPPKCLEFPAHQWWRPATEIPVGEHKNPLPFLHVKFRPWGKRMERSNCTGQLTKGASQSRLCWWGRERTQPTGWRNKEKLTGLCIWHVRDSLTSGTAGSRCPHKAFKHLSLSIFQFWFSSVFTSLLDNLSVWWLQQLQAQNLPERISPPNTSRRSLLAFLFWVWPRSQGHHWPTHCGQGSRVCGMAMLGSWTHTWAREQGCLLTSQGWQ